MVSMHHGRGLRQVKANAFVAVLVGNQKDG